MRAIVISAALIAASLFAADVAAQDFRWNGRVAAGDAIEIKSVNGSVEASLASGDQIEVVARKSARRSDEASVTIEVIEHAGGVTICALYPTPRNARRDNECGPGSEGRMSTQNNDVVVDFVVRVPANVRFVGRTVNGDVDATGLRSDVAVHTVNGDVAVSTTGFGEGRTVNGSISIRMGRLAQDLELETVNGSITLEVTGDLDADLDASTVNGSIDSDFPMTVNGRLTRQRVRATIGDGGPELRLKTVNGGIRIRRR